MSSELVYRMRTCAAAILLRDGDEVSLLHRDAADLLVAAANLLDEPDELGEPMPILQATPTQQYREQAAANPAANPAAANQGASWDTTKLPTQPFDFGAHNPRPCPSCGSVDVRKVAIEHKKLMLICPHCGHRWEFAK